MSPEGLSGFLLCLERTLAKESLVVETDSHLLERFLDTRDETALRVLIARHGPMVYRVCRRTLSNEQAAEDAFQAAFLILIRKASSIRNRQSLASWLHGVAHQAALRARTSVMRRREHEAQAAGQRSSFGEDERTWCEVRAILDDELTRLPERLRAPLVLCYLEGLTQDEAAQQLGSSSRTLRRHLERGRAVLRARLTRRGLTLSAGLLAVLSSECVTAMPEELAAATRNSLFAGASRAVTSTVSSLAEAVMETMHRHSLNLKGIAAAILGVSLAIAAPGSLLVEHLNSMTPQTPPRIEAPTPVQLAAAPIASPNPDDAGRLEKAAANARTRAINYLKLKQATDGSWEDNGLVSLTDMEGGVTAVTTLALLESGVTPSDRAIVKAVQYLLQVPRKKTYVVSLQTQILARVDAKKHLKRIQENADWLIKTMLKDGEKLQGWSYPGNGIGDGSNTHFAVMGLHAAAEAGATVEEKLWKQIAEHYVKTSGPKGWRYHPDPQLKDLATNSMTACALVGLAVAARHQKEAKPLDPCFEHGLKLLADGNLENSLSTGYALMVIAELGRLRETKRFQVGDQTWEWYQSGAEKVIKSQNQEGAFVLGKKGIDAQQPLATAFGLYLLGAPEPAPKQNPGRKEPSDKPGISQEVIDAWKKAGAEFGTVAIDELGAMNGYFHATTWHADDKPTNTRLPAFRIASENPAGKGYVDPTGLPAPEAPFALVCHWWQLEKLPALPQLQAVLIDGQLFQANLDDSKEMNRNLNALAKFPQLRVLDLRQQNLDAGGFQAIGGVQHLQHLNYDITQATDAGVKELARLKELRTLTLIGPDVTDASVKELVALRKLKKLQFHSPRITGESLKALATLPQLEELTFYTAEFLRDSDLQELRAFTQLKSLNLPGTYVSLDTARVIGRLKQLESLELAWTHLTTDASLRELEPLTQLRVLGLGWTDVTDSGLKALGEMRRLECLSLASTRISGIGLKKLTSLEHLESVDLSNSPVTAEGARALAALPALKSLNLENVKEADSICSELAAAPRLETLNFHNAKISDAGVKELARLQTLRTLDLGFVDTVTDACVSDLARIKGLREIRLYGAKISDEAVATLRRALPLCKIDCR
jgi:RNA polymerase sigma factor (sigma-70 family)